MRLRRVSVVGTSGSGKTTMGKSISAAIGVPFVELDAIHHQPGWNELPADEFQDRVRPIVAGDAWVIDGNYTSKGVLDLVWERADTVVWLDLPRSVAVQRVARRTLRRAFTREELWNGNRERWFAFLDPRPEQNMILWSWTTHDRNRTKYAARVEDPRWSHVEFVRLTNTAEADAFVESLRSR